MSRVARALPVAAAAVAVVTATAGLASGVTVRSDARLSVLSPRDGARVPPGFVLAWERGGHAGRFAVVVDATVPAPGAEIAPGESVLVTESTALRLTLAPRTGGSPSARNWHRVVIVPVDAHGRRVGERTAAVSVRGGTDE